MSDSKNVVISELELSESQVDYWLLNLICNERYLLNYECDICAVLDISILTEAVNFVVGKHEAFWVSPLKRVMNQRLHKKEAFEVKFWDISSLDEVDKLSKLECINRSAAEYDYSSMPACFTGVIKYSENRHIFLLVSPHFNVDASSLTSVAEEIFNAYRLRDAGLGFSEICQQENYSLSVYVEWEQDLRADFTGYKASLDYLQRSYEKTTPFWLSSRYVDLNSDTDCSSSSCRIEAATFTSLRRLFGASKVTNYIGTLTIIYMAVARLTNNREFVLTGLFNDRIRDEMHSLIGPVYGEIYFAGDDSKVNNFELLSSEFRSQLIATNKYNNCEQSVALYQIERNKWKGLGRITFKLITLIAFVLSKTKLNTPKYNYRLFGYYLSYYAYPSFKRFELKLKTILGIKKSSYPVELEVNYFNVSNNKFDGSDERNLSQKSEWFDFEKEASYSGFPYLSFNLEDYSDYMDIELEGEDVSRNFKDEVIDEINRQIAVVLKDGK